MVANLPWGIFQRPTQQGAATTTCQDLYFRIVPVAVTVTVIPRAYLHGQHLVTSFFLSRAFSWHVTDNHPRRRSPRLFWLAQRRVTWNLAVIVTRTRQSLVVQRLLSCTPREHLSNLQNLCPVIRWQLFDLLRCQGHDLCIQRLLLCLALLWRLGWRLCVRLRLRR